MENACGILSESFCRLVFGTMSLATSPSWVLLWWRPKHSSSGLLLARETNKSVYMGAVDELNGGRTIRRLM
jgi:hypothetical protein